MKITVFGANGKVGRLVVAEALNRGYKVTAFVHSESSLPKNENLKIIKGDVHNRYEAAKGVQGSDAVISALGSWGTKSKDILSSGMNSIIPAMKQQGVTRIISLTGSDARANGDKLSLLHRLSHAGIMVVGRKVIKDGEQHIRLLEQSALEWTVVRSPAMTELGDPENFALSTKRALPWQTINRHSVAKAMVDQLEPNSWVNRAPFIHRGKS